MGTVGRTSSFYVIQKQVKEQKMKNRIKYLLGVLIISPICMYSKDFNVSSPDNKIILSVNVKDRISWSVNYNSTPVILPSFISLQTKEKTLGANPHIRKSKIHTVNETITTSIYKKRIIEDNYKELNLTFAGNYALQFRVYDDGVAYRWIGLQKEDITILSEGVEFNFAKKNSKVYVGYVNAKEEDVYSCSFENTYQHIPLEKMSDFWPAFTPILVEQDGIKCGITEADLEDYPGMFLRINKKTRQGLIADFAPYPVEEVQGGHNNLQSLVVKRADYTAKTKGDRTFPWRVVIIADEDKDLLNNDMVYKLASPCRINDTSWIKPGKVMREVTLTTEGGKALVDFAVKRRLQYIHFDAGWYGFEYDKSSDATTVTLDPRRNEQIDALNLQEVISYAKSKGIGVILYVNQRALQQQLDEILPLYKSWGIAGIKFGFVQVGSQIWTRWMHEAVKKCAQYGLMVDIHDEYRPTGFSRTYPNLMTQEGIRGNEEMPDATHNTTLPFTRFLAGAGDYTLCYFNNRVKNTKAHQLAMAAVYYSPLQFMYWYDRPEFYKGEEELEFWKAIPSIWDDSRALDGEIGEYIVQARRSGNDWFVGAMTNTEPRTVTLTTDFLESGKKYMLHLYEDDDKLNTRTKVRSTHKKIKAGDKLVLKLKASGGAALHFTPLKK